MRKGQRVLQKMCCNFMLNCNIRPIPLLSYFSVVVRLIWLFHHMLSVIYTETARFWLWNYCPVLWCTQAIEDIMARWWYPFVCTLQYLIIIIMHTYLKVLSSVCRKLSHSFNYHSCNIWGPSMCCMMIVSMCALSYHRHIGGMANLQLSRLGYETMVCTVP